MMPNSVDRHESSRACRVARLPYAAEELRRGMLVVDPDKRLGLHEKQVRVVADAAPIDRYDTTCVVVDYDVAGSNVTGRFTTTRLATVWVVGGDGRF